MGEYTGTTNLMSHPSSPGPRSLLSKLLLAVAAAALAVLGVIGLLIPVLPGLLFLAAAAGCLCLASRRIGSRVERRLASHPHHRATLQRWRAGRALPFWQRVRLGCLLTLRSVLPRQQP